jgi:hypothetical protein
VLIFTDEGYGAISNNRGNRDLFLFELRARLFIVSQQYLMVLNECLKMTFYKQQCCNSVPFPTLISIVSVYLY